MQTSFFEFWGLIWFHLGLMCGVGLCFEVVWRGYLLWPEGIGIKATRAREVTGRKNRGLQRPVRVSSELLPVLAAF